MTATVIPVSDLGLMGGMFDPVHNGHLNIAMTAQRDLQLDHLALLPCGNPVHRANDMAPAAHRLAMLALAVQGCPALGVDDRECRQATPSYAINSLRAIRAERPGTRLYYLMGQDAFNQFHTWLDWRGIFGLAHIVVAARPGAATQLDVELAREVGDRQVADVAGLRSAKSGNILFMEMSMLDISSSQIRSRLSRHEAIDDLVPATVADYIHTNGLYTPEKIQ